MNNILENAKQIVCIVPKGLGRILVEALSTEKGIYNANFSHARGVGRSDVMDKGVGEQPERDVFAVTVGAEDADDVFEFLYFKAGLDQRDSGLIYMQSTPKTSVMWIPDLPNNN
jgi:hypothetical protein